MFRRRKNGQEDPLSGSDLDYRGHDRDELDYGDDMSMADSGSGDEPPQGTPPQRPIPGAPPQRQPTTTPARTTSTAPVRSESTGRRLDLTPTAAARRMPPSASGSSADSDRRLIVGRYISLSGEINACDHLEVEGRIEAKLSECETIYIYEEGVFKGSAEVDTATIAGRFEGDLVVRGRLSLIGTGVVEGNTRYGELQVDAGGRIIGTLQPLENPQSGAKSSSG